MSGSKVHAHISAVQSKLGLVRNNINRNDLPNKVESKIQHKIHELERLADDCITLSEGKEVIRG